LTSGTFIDQHVIWELVPKLAEQLFRHISDNAKIKKLFLDTDELNDQMKLYSNEIIGIHLESDDKLITSGIQALLKDATFTNSYTERIQPNVTVSYFTAQKRAKKFKTDYLNDYGEPIKLDPIIATTPIRKVPFYLPPPSSCLTMCMSKTNSLLIYLTLLHNIIHKLNMILILLYYSK